MTAGSTTASSTRSQADLASAPTGHGLGTLHQQLATLYGGRLEVRRD